MANAVDVSNAYINTLKQASGATAPGKTSGDDGGVSFGALLKQSTQSAIDAQYTSEKVAAKAVLGKADMTEVLQAVNDAEIALNTALAIRDRLVQSYQEIMRTPI
jgi:flagellar hook-basal body complex protein FliE